MSEIWDATYQAIRSKISSCNTEEIISSIINNNFSNISHLFDCLCQAVAAETTKPYVLMRPVIRLDGNMWCALYGDNIQEGVCGFGKSPDEACRDFDRNWNKKLEQ